MDNDLNGLADLLEDVTMGRDTTIEARRFTLSASEGERAGVTWFAILLFTLLPDLLLGQVQQAWVARYNGGPSVGTNVFLALDSQGNLIVGGHGTSTNGDYDYLILKYSPAGVEQWTARYNSAPGSNDQVRAMAVDSDGNVYVTGTSATVKYSTDGTPQWVAPYGARALALDPNGDVCITGFSESTYATAKIDKEAGTNVWLRTFSYLNRAGYPDISQAIAVDSRSNIFVGGHVYCAIGSRPIENYLNRMIVGYDTQGNQIMATVPGPTGCFHTSVNMKGLGVDSAGNVYDATDTSYWTASIMKYGSDGTLQWQTFGSYVVRGLGAMVTDHNGFVYLTGKSAVPTPNIGTEKISPSGSNVWKSGYFGNTFRGGNAITVDDSGNVIISGQVRSGETSDDYVTIKHDADGHEQWVQLYNGPGNGPDVATAIAVAPDGSVYVSGTSANTNGVLEITTIKYVQFQPIAVETNRNVQLQFPGAPGQSNRVEATTDFLDWLDLGFSIADTNGLLRFLDTNAPSYPHRFYRTVPP